MLQIFHKMYIYFSKIREFDSCHAIFYFFSTVFYVFLIIFLKALKMYLILHKLVMGNQAGVNTEEASKLPKLLVSVAACRVVCKEKAMMFSVKPTVCGVLHTIKSWE